MPYLVTINQSCGDFECHPNCRGRKRTNQAVGTLQEAKQQGFEWIDTHLTFASEHWRTRRADMYALGEPGGIVGPLLDGTMIEIKPLTILQLLADTDVRRRVNLASEDATLTAQAVLAYNKLRS